MDDVRRGGRRSAISDQEIETLADRGMTSVQIAQWFTERGRRITSQRIGQRLARIRDGNEERANYILPWRIKSPEHSQGWVYTAVVAYAKHQQGKGVTAYELDLSRKLEKYAADRGAVLGYDHESGFYWRNRRPRDDGSLLVKD